MDVGDFQFSFPVEKRHACDECFLKTFISAPTTEPFEDRGVADLLLPCDWIDTDRHFLPLTTGIQFVEDVVQYSPEGDLWFLPSLRQ